MARKKSKSRAKKKPARAASRPKARARAAKKAPGGKAAAKPAARGAASPGASNDVERRWKEYWAARKKLEAAVETVKAARDALNEAQEAERSCRSAFDEIKRSLTELLDVDPAGGPQRGPTPMPRRQQGTAPLGLPSAHGEGASSDEEDDADPSAAS